MSRDDRLRPLIDAALHRYFSRLTRRYVPLVAGIAVVALVAFVLPSKQHDATSNVASRSGRAATGAVSAAGAGTTGATGPATGGTPSAGPGAGAAPQSVGSED